MPAEDVRVPQPDDSPPQSPASPQPEPAYSGFKRAFHLVDLIASRVPMGPRKKSKPELNQPPAEQLVAAAAKTDAVAIPQSQPPASSEASDQPRSTDSPSASIPVPEKTAGRSPSLGELKSGWYGSWKQKAKPVTEVARESIAANGSPRAITVVTGSPPTPSKPKQPLENVATPSPKRLISGTVKSAKGTPLLATTTNISITSSRKLEPPKPLESSLLKDSQASINDSQPDLPPASQPLPPDPTPETEKLPDRPSTPSGGGWLSGWWSRPDGYAESVKKLSQTIPKDTVLDVAKAMSLPDLVPSHAPEQPPALSAVSNGNARQEGDVKPSPAPSLAPDQSKSWFWIWSRSQNAAPPSRPHGEGHPVEESAQSENRPPTLDPPQPAVDSNASMKDGRDGSRRNASGWAFWSTESKSTEGKSSDVHKQVGQLAVANTPSQDRPEAAQFNEVETPISKEPAKPASRKSKPSPSTPASQSPAKAVGSTQPQAAAEVPKQVKPDSTQKNLILPEFTNTYSIVEQPSIWQQLRQYFVGSEMQTPHLHIAQNPPRVKKALAIGIHGFFPAPIVQKLLGPPTGTSIKFANNAATAVKAWAEERGFECDIEKVALEGEGLIGDRVDTLWKLLLNWMDHIRSADLILIACHSQGVPVAVMLVERLIKFKCIAPGARIGICAMAGVNLGPFPEYKTQIFGRSALELFDFSNPKSKVSTLYVTALDEILKSGVKVVFVGSMDDQLVSLESSTFSNISHPGIYRAAFVDGRLYVSDFITELVGFAFKLRNLGLSDHGLIRELSPALAGSLYSGEGHSRLYDCPQLYSLAVSHTLETTSPSDGIPLVRNYEGPTGSKESNPFFLPWAMRGILEEDKVRKELGDECRQLLALFDEWRPTTKGLKDVKFRLEALRSKL